MTVQPSPSSFGFPRQLEDHRQRRQSRTTSLRLPRSVAYRRERRLDRVRRSQMKPMLCREIVERKQDVLVLDQALDGFRVLGFVLLLELREGVQGILASGRQIHFVDQLFRIRLHSLRHFVQNVGCFVNPAALLPDPGESLLQGGPEAQGTVADGKFWNCGHAFSLQPLEKRQPRCLALAVSVENAYELLLAVTQRAHQHEQAGAISFEAHVEVDPIGPHVDILFLAQISIGPIVIIFLPAFFEADDVCRAQPGCVGSQDGRQGFAEAPCRDTLEVENRNQRIYAGGASHEGWEDLAGELFAFALVANTRLLDANRSNASDQIPLGQMSVADDKPMTAFIDEGSVAFHVLTDLGFKGCLEHPACSLPDQFIQDALRVFGRFISTSEGNHVILAHERVLFAPLQGSVFWFLQTKGYAHFSYALKHNFRSYLKNYPGEPLATIHGSLNIAPTQRPNDTLQIVLIWQVEGSVDYMVDQEINLTNDSFGLYHLDLFLPPPDNAMFTDPETGGKIGGANIFTYDDPNGEGPINLADYDPEDYPSLMYRWRGGAENKMLLYAKDGFAEGSNIALNLGGPISPGFYLLSIEGDCYYDFAYGGNARDSQGDPCSAASNHVELISIDTSVDLNIVNDISDFRYAVNPW